MRVKHLKVRNYTSLLDIELSDLPDLVVFVGKNSSGKSNLIDALALFFLAFGDGEIEHLGPEDSYQHLFPNHSYPTGQPPEIAITLTLVSEEWAQLLDVEENAGSRLEREEIYLEKRILCVEGSTQWKTQAAYIGDVQILGDEEAEAELVHMILDDPTDSSSGEIEIEFLVDGFLVNLGPLLESSFQVVYGAEGTRSWQDRFAERPSIVDTTHLGSLWEQSQSSGNQRQQWTRVAQQFEQIAPNEQRPVGVASSIQMEEGTLSIPIGMTGEGSQATLRLIDQLDRGPAIMAIEEPETHLHPTLVKQIGRVLGEMANKGKQLFVSTHSPFLVEQSTLDSLYVVKKHGHETQISSMRDISDLRALFLDLGIRPSDVLFSDAILLVEGLSDEVFFNHLSNKLDVSLAACHIKTIRAGGMPRGRRKIEFWAEVGRDAGLPLFLILDKNASDETQRAIKKDLIPEDRCLVLDKGNLEDCYPWPALEKVLSENFEVEVEAPIPVGERVQTLRRHLKKSGREKDWWKPLMAEEIVKVTRHEEIETGMADIVGFLRKVSYEVSAI